MIWPREISWRLRESHDSAEYPPPWPALLLHLLVLRLRRGLNLDPLQLEAVGEVRGVPLEDGLAVKLQGEVEGAEADL